MISLVGQLVSQLSSPKQRDNSPISPDLTFLTADKRVKFSRVSDSISKLLTLLERLLELLPAESRTCYAVLDGIWQLPPENREARRALAGILSLAAKLHEAAERGEQGPILKIILTEPFSTDALSEFLPEQESRSSDTSRRRGRRSIQPRSAPAYIKEPHAPEYVLGGGGGSGFNEAWINEQLGPMLRECTSASSSASSVAENSSSSEYGRSNRQHGRNNGPKLGGRLSVESPSRGSRQR